MVRNGRVHASEGGGRKARKERNVFWGRDGEEEVVGEGNTGKGERGRMEEGGGGGLEPWTRWGKMKAGLVVLLLTFFFSFLFYTIILRIERD
jgi:hypothetical protein